MHLSELLTILAEVPGDRIDHFNDAIRMAKTLEAERSALLRERDALQAFKEYVHQRLDEAGIATHPPGEHTDAGCRVGQRMDLLIGERDEAARKLNAITTEIQGADVSVQRTHDQDPTRYAVVDLDDWNRILALLSTQGSNTETK